MRKTYKDLIEETSELNVEEARTYFCEFFKPGNEDNYVMDIDADENSLEAIYKLFENGKTYIDKINDSLKINEYCKEALLLEIRGFEEPIVADDFAQVYYDYQKYDSFSDYKKECFINFLNLYSDFLMDVGNVTKSAKVLRKAIELSGDYSKANMRDLAFKYSMIENKDEFYNFYLDHELKYPEAYLLLIAILLKHDEFDKAKEVLNEMADTVKYSDYIYRMWELNDDNEEANEFKEAVDVCFDELISYPNYFSFCKENIEENRYKS